MPDIIFQVKVQYDLNTRKMIQDLRYFGMISHFMNYYWTFYLAVVLFSCSHTLLLSESLLSPSQFSREAEVLIYLLNPKVGPDFFILILYKVFFHVTQMHSGLFYSYSLGFLKKIGNVAF